jgi:hypothetical protein
MKAGLMKRGGALAVGLVVAGTLGLASAGARANAGAHRASVAAALPTITLAMDGRSITVGGTLESGAVTVQSSVSRVHQAEPTLVHLNPGATFEQAFQAAARHNGDPNYLDPYGSIVFDAAANAGTSTAQTTLMPGNYVALDTQGQDPQKWPHTEFTVAQSAAPAALPQPRATIASIEFNFRGPGTLHDGQLVRFENDGFLVHMIVGAQVKNVADAKRLTALAIAGKDRQAQKLAIGEEMFAGPLSSGAMQQSVLAAKPGVYVLMCFMDTQDGRSHTRLGMERTIRIVK